VVSTLGAVLNQVDKVVISDQLPLRDLGYYTVALTATGPLPLIGAALAAAALPRFAGQLTSSTDSPLHTTYRQSMHALTYLIVGVAFTLVFFPYAILLVWTGSSTVADETAVVLVLLAIAYLFNALYTIPYTLALAAGNTRLPLIVNAFGAPVIVLATILLVPRLGIVGAAAIWLVAMAAFFAVYLTCVHRVVLKGGLVATLVRGVLPYVGLGVVAFGVPAALSASSDDEALSLVALLFAGTAYLLIGFRMLPAELRAIPRGPVQRLLGISSPNRVP
jgi:O-antigen/teichoic acid export membrane protein